MLDGKMLRDATGTPIRRIERANSRLALAEPEPLTLANLTTKSLMRTVRVAICGHAYRQSCGVRHLEQEFLHVPGAGRAALGAQSAVQADVLVLGHDPPGAGAAARRRVPAVRLSGGGVEPLAQVVLRPVPGEGDAVDRADVDAGVALDARACR